VPHAGGWSGIAETGAPVPNDLQYDNTSWPTVERDHASVIGNFLDRDVGRIVDAIDALGLTENTMIIFASGSYSLL
jgi:arylsulfatase A-like enzyme